MKKYLATFLALLLGTAPLAAQPESAETKQVVVIGGGIGALTSAIYLQRAGINTLVIEGKTPGGALSQSPLVQNWPGEQAISGQDLVEKIRSQAEANGAKFLSHEVTEVDFSHADIQITSRDIYNAQKVQKIRAKACIIAVGSDPKMLGIPGESGDEGYWTKGVYSCAVCDGALYKDRTVAVIGGGDAAIIEADYLSNLAKKVYIVLRSGDFRTVETMRKNALINKENVEVIYDTKVKQIEGNGHKVTHLKLSTQEDLLVDGVFLAIGSKPNTDIFKTQLDLDEQGYIKLIKDQQTSRLGVFAIGDVVDPHYKQAISAAGDGAKAALQVERYLGSIKHSPAAKEEASKVALSSNQQVSSIYEVESQDDFYQQIAPQKTPVVVDFYSPLCGPCKTLAPKLKEIASQYQGKIRFIKVDVTKHPTLAENYNIYGVPTILVVNTTGKVVKQSVGLDDIQITLTKLGQILQ